MVFEMASFNSVIIASSSVGLLWKIAPAANLWPPPSGNASAISLQDNVCYIIALFILMVIGR